VDNQTQEELSGGEMFAPEVDSQREHTDQPCYQKPLKSKPYVLLETPFVKNLRTILEKGGNRPVSIIDNEQYALGTLCVLRILLPTVFLILLITNILRIVLLEESAGHWTEMVIVLQVHATWPFLPVLFPLLWYMLNLLGHARILAVFDEGKGQQYEYSDLDRFSVETNISEDEIVVHYEWRQVWRHFLELLKGPSISLPRTANSVHALGNINSLCCIDKKGILSWPNPTAEKVFFFSSGTQCKHAGKKGKVEAELEKAQKDAAEEEEENVDQALTPDYHIEVLDLTHDAKDAFGLQFDDPAWKKYLNSLKPLLPEDCSHLYPLARSPTPTRSWDVESLDSRLLKGTHLSISVDSLYSESSSASIKDAVDLFKAQCNQIFIGMVTMQYQARLDVVKLIENLETACIRFVHFSEENELRSRVFSEKMGLEAGWNCHISLLSGDYTESTSQPDSNTSNQSHRTSKISSHVSVDTLNRSSRSRDKSRRHSAPSLIHIEDPQVRFSMQPSEENCNSIRSDDTVQTVVVNQVIHQSGQSSQAVNQSVQMSQSDELDGAVCNIDGVQVEEVKIQETPRSHFTSDETPYTNFSSNVSPEGYFQPDIHIAYQSDLSPAEEQEMVEIAAHYGSHRTSNTDDTMSGGFDMSNRAKLPKGIENIRPHLEHVDNVPLLVSLFTDCTKGTTREMIQIMQEYGEVVCCIGSTACIQNTASFIQADASIGLEPQYPQLCMKQSVMTEPWEEEELSPMDINRLLNSLGCSLVFFRSDNISLTQLIAEARHHCVAMRNSFLCLLSYHLSISLIQLLAAIFLLPPVLASRHLLWLLLVVAPSLSLVHFGNPLDPHIMTLASGKNEDYLTKDVIVQYIVYFILRFVPSLLIILLCFGFSLYGLCVKNTGMAEACHACFGNMQYSTPGDWRGWSTQYHSGLVLAQNILLSQFVLYTVLSSVSSVHRYYHLWRRAPCTNKLWCVVAPAILVLQVIYSICDVHVYREGESALLADIPVVTWVVAVIWPLLLLPLLEMVKMHEIKLAVRYQKRARLNFGTKLGMNSPF
ncbi:transmembrane protein 94-like, partial [Lingula anatina]|uniref:Transmembrane protein 94-like n=1 Tax=Lingula anatina TaxID=7574 RepID=A0A1S3J3R8_LINAN